MRLPAAKSNVLDSGGGRGLMLGLRLGIGLGDGCEGDGEGGVESTKLNVAASHAPLAPQSLNGPRRRADSTGMKPRLEVTTSARMSEAAGVTAVE
jgi:hypothetical protein